MTPICHIEPDNLPARVRLSSAYAGYQISTAEYVHAQHVAELEEDFKPPFCETTWEKVRAGDTVLMAWASLGEIVKVDVLGCGNEIALDGRPLVIAALGALGEIFNRAFDPEETVFAQQR